MQQSSSQGRKRKAVEAFPKPQQQQQLLTLEALRASFSAQLQTVFQHNTSGHKALVSAHDQLIDRLAYRSQGAFEDLCDEMEKANQINSSAQDKHKKQQATLANAAQAVLDAICDDSLLLYPAQELQRSFLGEVALLNTKLTGGAQ